MRRLNRTEINDLSDWMSDVRDKMAKGIESPASPAFSTEQEYALSALRVAKTMQEIADNVAANAAQKARNAGCTPTDMAKAFGVSKQAGWKRWRDGVPTAVAIVVDDRDVW
jgi:hypothetical protein